MKSPDACHRQAATEPSSGASRNASNTIDREDPGVASQLDTQQHLAMLTSRLPVGLAVPVVAFEPGNSPRVIGTVEQGDTRTVLDEVARLRDRCSMYVGMYAIERDRLNWLIEHRRRGGVGDVDAVVAVIADIDFEGPNHKAAKRYPQTEVEALAVADGVGIPWTHVLHTGGGLNCTAVLKEPLWIENDEEREAARNLLELFANGVEASAGRLGREVDHLADPCRITRLAGTLNHKSDPPQATRVLHFNRDATIDDEHLAGASVAVDPHADGRRSIDHPQGTTPRPPHAKVTRITDGPNILSYVDRLDWALILEPFGFEQASGGQVGGEVVERWRRPGAASNYSMTCWPGGGCTVHSDAVPGLPAGKYSKADVWAHLCGVTVAELSGQILKEVSV